MNKIRVGQGYDIHKMELGLSLILGGVNITHTKGPKGHSDGDVLIHAICDSLLGAAGLKSIGFYFPSNKKNEDISSLVIINKVVELLSDSKIKISNIDGTIIAEEPKIEPYLETIRNKLAKLLKVSLDSISIKVKSRDGLDEVGKGNAIEVYVVSLIEITKGS